MEVLIAKVKARRGALTSGVSVGGFSTHLNTGVFNPSATSPYSFGFNIGGLSLVVIQDCKQNKE